MQAEHPPVTPVADGVEVLRDSGVLLHGGIRRLHVEAAKSLHVRLGEHDLRRRTDHDAGVRRVRPLRQPAALAVHLEKRRHHAVHALRRDERKERMLGAVGVPQRIAAVHLAVVYLVVESGVVSSALVDLARIEERMVESRVEDCLHVVRRVDLDAGEHRLPFALRRRRHLVERFAADLLLKVGPGLLGGDERKPNLEFALGRFVREPPSAEVRQLIAVLRVHAVSVDAAFGERGGHFLVKSAYPRRMRRRGERIGASVRRRDTRQVRRRLQPHDPRRCDRHAHLAPVAHPDGGLARQDEAQKVLIRRIEAESADAVRARHRHEVERPERHARVGLHSAVLRALPFRADERVYAVERPRPRDRRERGKHNQ